jgi:hypothetical protein
VVKPRGEAEQVGRREEAKVAGSENISFRGTVTARVGVARFSLRLLAGVDQENCSH